MTSFFSPVPAPQKTVKHFAVRARDSVCDMTVEPHSPVDDVNGAPADVAQATPTADADAPARAAFVLGPVVSPVAVAPITAAPTDPKMHRTPRMLLNATQTERCPGIVLTADEPARAAVVLGHVVSPVAEAPINAAPTDPDNASDTANAGVLTASQTEFVRCPGIVLAVPSPENENYPFGIHSLR